MTYEYILQVKGKDHIIGGRTWLMGVINITPDSFSDGGLYLDKDNAVKRGLELAEEGADIIDIGGESTRPGSESIPLEEELRRVIPVISTLRKKIDTLISVDTTKSLVAQAALDAGADIINDISAFGFDPQMAALIAQKNAPVVLMHMKGTPKTMQVNPFYEDVVKEVKYFFKAKLEDVQTQGIRKEKIILDPGIGFGKRFEDNLALINNLHELADLGCPILIGVSRKSFIGRILGSSPQERLEGTIASAVMSIAHGASILRVHDVAYVKKAVLVADAIMKECFQPNTPAQNKEKKRTYAF